MPVDFTVVGEALVDLVESPDAPQTFTAHAGGSPYNVAITLARLGASVSLAARSGADAFGALLEDKARTSGVRFDRWERAAEPTSLAVASVDAAGIASYDFYLDSTAGLGWGVSLAENVPAGGVLHVGSIASWRAPSAAVVQALQERAYAAHAVLITGLDAARTTVERSVAAAHLVKASDEDVALLYAGSSLAEVARHWCSLGTMLVVITRGHEGAIAFTAAGELLRRPAVRVSLVDTVGAGDSFAGGLLAGLAEHGITTPVALLAGLDTAAVPTAIDQAILVSAMTCERSGADPPTREELDARRN